MHAHTNRISIFKTLLVLCVLASATLLGQYFARIFNSDGSNLPLSSVATWQQQQPTYQAQVFPMPSNYPLDRQPRLASQPQPVDIAQQTNNFNPYVQPSGLAEVNRDRETATLPQTSQPESAPSQSNFPSSGLAPGTLGYTQPLVPQGYNSVVRPIITRVPDPNQPGGFRENVTYYETLTVPYSTGSNQEQPVTPEIRRLLQELRAQNPDSRDEQKLADLRKELEKEFQAKHDSQVKRLEKLLADVEQAQKILDQRDKQRAEIIDRRVAELLGQSDPLGWDYSLEGNRPNGNFSNPTRMQGDSNPYPSTRPSLPTPNLPTPSLPPSTFGTYPTPANNLYETNPNYAVNPSSPTPPKPPVARTIPAPAKRAQPGAGPDEPTSASNWNSGTPTTEPYDGLVAIGYRWKGLKEQFELAEEKHRLGLLGQSEYVKIKNDLAASEAQWQQQLSELERTVRIKELALEDARLEEEIAESNIAYEKERSFRMSRSSNQNPVDPSNIDSLVGKRQQAKNAVLRAQLELEAVKDQITWAKEFQQQLETKAEAPTEKEDPQASESQTTQEPAASTSGPIPPAIESTGT